jgi:hypothetical protein
MGCASSLIRFRFLFSSGNAILSVLIGSVDARGDEGGVLLMLKLGA